MEHKNIYIFSGECVKGKVGEETEIEGMGGMPLCVGDIVKLWVKNSDGQFDSSRGLTAIVSDKYQSFSNGTVELTGDNTTYCMGIKSSIIGETFIIELVKSHKDIITGEHWPDFGFSYGYSEAADLLEGE